MICHIGHGRRRLLFLFDTDRAEAFWTSDDGKLHHISFTDRIVGLVDVKENLHSIILNDKTEAFRGIKVIDPAFLYGVFGKV